MSVLVAHLVGVPERMEAGRRETVGTWGCWSRPSEIAGLRSSTGRKLLEASVVQIARVLK